MRIVAATFVAFAGFTTFILSVLEILKNHLGVDTQKLLLNLGDAVGGTLNDWQVSLFAWTEIFFEPSFWVELAGTIIGAGLVAIGHLLLRLSQIRKKVHMLEKVWDDLREK